VARFLWPTVFDIVAHLSSFYCASA